LADVRIDEFQIPHLTTSPIHWRFLIIVHNNLILYHKTTILNLTKRFYSMITTGKYLEEIVEILNNFKSEVQTFSALGFVNINKHSENFVKRLLNLSYNYELENLNKGKSNFPGIDLGDTSESIAYQISATKKSEKIDETLVKCLKYNHYNTFKIINVFILTNKQSSYTIKTVTEPHFSFTPELNIMDFNDLYRIIEHLPPSRMAAMHEYIKAELQPVIESIKTNKSPEEKHLLDINAGMSESRMRTYSHWKSKVTIKTENISVPEIYTKLNGLLAKPALKTKFLQIFNEALRRSQSNKEILYLQKLLTTYTQNYFYGNAMAIEPSTITVERANYTDGEILLNLFQEMIMLLTCILFFSKQTKNKFEIQVLISIKSNTKVYFHPQGSLVIKHIFSSYTLDSPFELDETITNVRASTLVDFLQKVMYGFICHEPTLISNEPFISINREETDFVINNIKVELGIGD
jgi:hypothetical protein